MKQASQKMTRAKFQITLWYFKPSGKFYTEATFAWEGRANAAGGCYMPDVAAAVRGWRDQGGQGSMPGLSVYSGGWDGPILVNCEQGYPVLLLPREGEPS